VKIFQGKNAYVAMERHELLSRSKSHDQLDCSGTTEGNGSIQ